MCISIDWGYPDGPTGSRRWPITSTGISRTASSASCRGTGWPPSTSSASARAECSACAIAPLNPRRVRNLVTMVTPVDFHTAGGSVVEMGPRKIDVPALGGRGQRFGRAPESTVPVADAVPSDAAEIRATCCGRAPIRRTSRTSMRVEQWIFDSPDQAGAAFEEFVVWLYQENRLVRQSRSRSPAARSICARCAMPMLNLIGKHDHLVPPDASRGPAAAWSAARTTRRWNSISDTSACTSARARNTRCRADRPVARCAMNPGAYIYTPPLTLIC